MNDAPGPFSAGLKSDGRGADGRFVAGGPAGPGRPKGSRHTVLAVLDAIGAEAAEAVLRRVVEDARAGDVRAAEVLLRRLWPAPKGRPVEVALPPAADAGGLVTAMAAVLAATAAGQITPEEGRTLATMVEAMGRTIAMGELAERVAALEAALPLDAG